MDTFIRLLLTFAASVALQLLLKTWARWLGLVDVPLGRKLHEGVTPVTGGIAVFCAFGLAIALTAPTWDAILLLPLAGMGLFVLCGMVDDLLHLPAGLKLVIQAAAALIVLAPGDTILRHVGGLPLLGEIDTGFLALPFSALFVVGLVNAFNMIDGLDGLAGGASVIALAWLLAAASIVGGAEATLATIGLALAAVSGFLVFNMRHPWRDRASVFLGDAGSMLIGAVLAWASLGLMGRGPAPVPPVVVLWVLAVPLCDCASVILRRLHHGANPMRPDRMHLHHLLRDAGLTVEQAVAVILFASAATGAVGVLGWQMGASNGLLISAFVLLAVSHATAVQALLRSRLSPGNPLKVSTFGGSSLL